jgi:hypothetical protein
MYKFFYISEDKNLINYTALKCTCVNNNSQSFNVIKYYKLYNDLNEKNVIGNLLLNFNYVKLNSKEYFYTGNYTIILSDGNIFIPFSKITNIPLTKCFKLQIQSTIDLLGIGQTLNFLGKNFKVTFEYFNDNKRNIIIMSL